MSDDSGRTATSRVFISYRREETAYPAGWLYDRLDERFGDAQVFKDVDSIPLGDDFVEAITRAVGSCDVLLAMIGDRWLTATDERGRRRLDDPHDFVRLEIEAALARDVRVIPVLVDGARMPRAEELPESLASLVRRQALELSSSRFDSDTNRLVKVLASTLADVKAAAHERSAATAGPVGAAVASDGPAQATERADSTNPPRRRWGPALAIGAVITVVTLVVAVILIAGGNDDDDGAASSTEGGIEVDRSTVTSADGLELSGLDYDVRNNPPVVGDTFTLSYSLRNVTDEPLEFAVTFVGARNPADENRDEEMNEGVVLAPGESVSAQGRVLLDSAGTWLVWPCYELTDGQLCPDEWQVISFIVS